MLYVTATQMWGSPAQVLQALLPLAWAWRNAGWQSSFSLSAQGFGLDSASASTGKFIKMQIPGPGANVSPRSGSVALRWGQESAF